MRITLAALDWTTQPTCISGLFPPSSSVLSSAKSLSILSWLLPTMAALCLLLAVFAASACSGKLKIYLSSHLEYLPLRLFGPILGSIDSMRMSSDWCWNMKYGIWVLSFSPSFLCWFAGNCRFISDPLVIIYFLFIKKYPHCTVLSWCGCKGGGFTNHSFSNIGFSWQRALILLFF